MPDFTTKPTLRWQMLFEGPWPMAVALLDGGRKLAAGNEEGQIFLWDLTNTEGATQPEKAGGERARTAPTLAPYRQLVGHENGITRLHALPDGKTLVSASLDRTLRIWDTTAAPTSKATVILDRETREQTARRTGKKDGLNAPGVEVETQPFAHVLQGHGDWIASLAISRDGKRLISGDYGSRVIVWDVAERKEVARWTGLPWNWIVAVALSPDGQTAAVSEHRYKRDDFDVPAAAVRLWNVSDAQPKLDVLKVQFPNYKPESTTYEASQTWRKFVANGLITASFSPDGKLVAFGQGGETDTGKLHVIDVETGKLVRDVASHQYGITDARFSSDGRYLISAGRDTSIRVCQVEDGKEVLQVGAPRGGQFKDWFSAFDLSPDEKTLAAADIAGLVQVWTFDAPGREN